MIKKTYLAQQIEITTLLRFLVDASHRPVVLRGGSAEVQLKDILRVIYRSQKHED